MDAAQLSFTSLQSYNANMSWTLNLKMATGQHILIYKSSQSPKSFIWMVYDDDEMKKDF